MLPNTPRDAPGLLAHELAELRGRLRPSPSPSGADPAALGRLQVTAALLPELADRAPGFLRLGLELDRLLARIVAEPGIWPAILDPFLDDLADFLDDRLAACDRGDDPAAGPGWEERCSVWRRLGTPREMMAVLEREMRRWEGRWPDAGPAVAADWRAFRAAADRVFAGGDAGSSVEPAGGGAVVLSLGGALRREQVRARLAAMGFEIVAAPEPGCEEALAAGIRARAVLADDLEPGRRLSRLVRQREGDRSWALVLVATGDCDPAAENARARRLGADGAWCEPWRPDELRRILQHPSHP
jgi:hypothetical protein